MNNYELIKQETAVAWYLAKDELFKTERWNDIEIIAERLGVYVSANRKVILNLSDIQNLIGLAFDDLWENFKEKFEKYLKEVLGEK
jgi:hypothetical protein